MGSTNKWIVWVLTGAILCAGIVLIGLGASYLVEYKQPKPLEDDQADEMEVAFDSKYFRIRYTRDQSTLLDIQPCMSEDGLKSLTSQVTSVDQSETQNPVRASLHFDAGAMMNVEIVELENSESVHCYETKWSSTSESLKPADCLAMSDYWFGGAEMYYQDWPVNSWNKHMSFFLSGDMYANDQDFGSVLERYWLSSSGIAVYVRPDVPLHVSMERNYICLKGSYETPYDTTAKHELKYVTCFGKTPQITHEYMMKNYFQRPSALPDLRMMKSPIWSTWAQYKKKIDQTIVLEYAEQILANGFSNSQLEIDDGYEKFYGDFTFDSGKFPDAAAMVQKLKDLGFRVTTWVTPFMNPTSPNHERGSDNGYFILNGNTGKSGLTTWWDGIGSLVDFTNPAACDWYVSLLENVRSTYGIDSFKFDAGEINYVRTIPNHKTHKELDNLGYYTKHYVECAARLGNQIEVRSAWNSQHLPVFLRMMDKDSNWSRAKGLKTLIPTALTFSLLGYPYVLPDMIGGNGYEGGFENTKLPDRELYIRWLQVTAFLPSMQFSFTPWQYDDEVVVLARKYVELHETVVYDELERASRDYVAGTTGIGPIRPVWWASSDDSRAYSVDDEFLLGDRYLVAPVVENGTRHRDVYLPGPMSKDGTKQLIWEDKLRGGPPVLGGTLLKDYAVELDEVSWWELAQA